INKCTFPYSYEANVDTIIKSPDILMNKSLSQYLLEKDDWDDKMIANSQYQTLHALQRTQCYYRNYDGAKELPRLLGYPKLKHEYVPPVPRCVEPDFQSQPYY